MMPHRIKLTREPEMGPAVEPCCFCGKRTKMWYAPKDVAVCKSCARVHTPGEVPSKEEWCAAVASRETRVALQRGVRAR